MSGRNREAARIHAALISVLPPNTDVTVTDDLEVRLAGTLLRAAWLPQGVHSAVDRLDPDVDMIVAPHLTGKAREVAERRGIGWVDEHGGASINAGPVIVIRPSVPARPPKSHWTRATALVAEALIDGEPATVAAVAAATGVSDATATRSLRLLTDTDLLAQTAARGPSSGRRLVDSNALLDAYTRQARLLHSDDALLTVAVDPRGIDQTMERLADRWDHAEQSWALTGALAADRLAPLLTEPSPLVILLAAANKPALHVAARQADLQPAAGGALTLQAFPGPGRLRTTLVDNLPCASWARVYADLLHSEGVRAREAASHLRQIMMESEHDG